MIALDTNVLVRYLVEDEAKQAEAARKLLEALAPTRSGFVCRKAMMELVWVLKWTYGQSRERISAVLEDLMATDGLVVDAVADMARSAMRYRHGVADFSDLMIARRRGAGWGAPALHVRPQGRATPGCRVAGCVGVVTRYGCRSDSPSRPAHRAVSPLV